MADRALCHLQLCATSTVLVAPTGLTFAHPKEPPLPPPSSRSTSQHTPAHTSHRPLGDPTLTPGKSMTTHAPQKTNSPSFRPATTSGHKNLALDYTGQSPVAQEDTDLTTNLLSPIPSRGQSQRPSSSTSRRGISRANTYSSSSTQPFLSHPQPAIHQPNKLVKRSFSQQPASTAVSHGSPHQRQIFRRPATSHQRSASWSIRLDQLAEKTNSTVTSADRLHPDRETLEPQFIHFPRIVRVRKAIKGLSRPFVERDTYDIRRIKPDGSRPTLLLAKSVLPADVGYEEEAIQLDSDSEKASTGTSTPPQHQPVVSSSPLRPQTSDSPIESERRRRQSFSFFRNSPSRKLSSASGPANKLKRKISQRISSAPAGVLHQMDGPKARQLHGRVSENTNQLAEEPLSKTAPVEPPSAQKSDRHEANPSHLRHVSMSSALSSSPDGSYKGQRVFSWGGGEEGDTSDTVYDSVRTGTTRSSYGTPRQPLETLFDRSTTSVHQDTSLKPFVFGPQETGSQRTLSTDKASFVSAQATPQARTPRRSPHQVFGYNDTQHEYDKGFADDEDDWDSLQDDISGHNRSGFLSAVSRTPRLSPSPSDAARTHTPRDTGLRNSVFDWSEPPAVDRGSDNDTPPRPKTVHGKKRQGQLGNQSTSRRAQGGLHARSQSVPAFQDLTGRRPDVTHKFGTWGVGSKGATEDWDDDFDFEQPSQSSPAIPVTHNSPPSNNTTILIPDNIQKQQTNVLANIGLLKEWGLLIEELKDLRVRAATLGIRGRDQVEVFDEVDAMIDLADQEHEDDALTVLRSPTSSQYFSDDDVEDGTPPRQVSAGQPRMSPSEMLKAVQHSNSVHSSPSFRYPDSPEHVSRPRKDSEAVAQSVIEALQQGRQRKPEPSAAVASSGRSKKMPFDTTTLKHIVPHVNMLMRQVKQLIREEEGLHTSPKVDRRARFTGNNDPYEAMPESPTAQKEFRLRLHRSLRGSPGITKPFKEEEDLVEQLQNMSTAERV